MKASYYKTVFSIWGILALGYQAQAASAYVTISLPTTGYCLEVKDSSKASGAVIQQNLCKSGAANQSFYVSTHDDGSYIIKNKNSGLCLEVKEASRVSGTLIHQVACTHTVQQNFTPMFMSTDMYSFISQLNGSCLSVAKAEKKVHALKNTVCNLGSNQAFKMTITSGSLPLIKESAINETVIAPVSGPSLSSKLKGVNITGAESGTYTGRYGYDFAYPKNSAIDYFVSKGFTTIRVPFKGGRLQPVQMGALDKTELARLDAVVQYARSKGVRVVLDPHDYGRMRIPGNVSGYIGTPEVPAPNFANFWARLAKVYKNQPNVIFNIMNEPHVQKATQWQASAVLAVSAIRAVGAKQLILIPGTSYTGAHSWAKTGGNGEAWQGFRESNYMFDVHQYLDKDSSGTNTACTLDSGKKRLIAFRDWAKANGKRGFIGEFGWSEQASCDPEGEDFMDFVSANSSVFVGWTYFGAGWYNGFMTLNQNNGVDRRQLNVLRDHL